MTLEGYEVLTVEEARAILRMSKNSIYRAIRTGEIPSIRVGPRLIRISRDTVKGIINGARDNHAAVKG